VTVTADVRPSRTIPRDPKAYPARRASRAVPGEPLIRAEKHRPFVTGRRQPSVRAADERRIGADHVQERMEPERLLGEREGEGADADDERALFSLVDGDEPQFDEPFDPPCHGSRTAPQALGQIFIRAADRLDRFSTGVHQGKSWVRLHEHRPGSTGHNRNSTGGHHDGSASCGWVPAW
jgi:hypothetical protein